MRAKTTPFNGKNLPIAAVILCASVAAASAAEPAAISGKTLQPGLNACYQSLADRETLYRIDAKPAFALGDSSPHPRIAPGPFSVVWTGVIVIRGEGPFLFDASLGGELTVTIDNTVVLKGRGDSDTAHIRSTDSLKREPGRYRLTIEYQSLPQVPARLQIGWEGSSFVREPLPAWLLKHAPDDLPPDAEKSARQDESAAAGRAAAGKFGCAQCHADAFPAVHAPPPGPALGSGVGARLNRDWLLKWLQNPSEVRPSARMPALFKADREGAIERWIVADYLLKDGKRTDAPAAGDHRRGRRDFLSIGCVACHFVPDMKRDEQSDLDRTAFEGLADRFPGPTLADFLTNPKLRYPDDRHPIFPMTPETARDISAYLMLWSKPIPQPATPLDQPVTPDEIAKTEQRLGVAGPDAAAKALLHSKGCTSCHEGLGDAPALKIPIVSQAGGCMSATGNLKFNLDAQMRSALTAYGLIAAKERHPSSADERRQLFAHLACDRCHRSGDSPSPLEKASSTLGGSLLEVVPYLRTPRLNNALSKYSREYITRAIRDGVSGIQQKAYTFRMPRFGDHAEAIVRALAERDGDLANEPPPPKPEADDPTLSGIGATLAGFEGYSCVSCHIWNGKKLNEADPAAVGPDLTTIAQRIRRDWFERWLDDPARIHTGTVMPKIFTKGSPATIQSVLDGDASRQKAALWAYLSLGKDAPIPKPLPAIPVDIPSPGAPPMVAQIPMHMTDGAKVESICIAYGTHDLLLYDVGTMSLRGVYTGAQILRTVRGRLRTFSLAGTPLPDFTATPAASLLESKPLGVELLGYDRLTDGARVRLRANFENRSVDGSETFRIVERNLEHEIKWGDKPAVAQPKYALPATKFVPEHYPTLPDSGKIDGSLERPGYRAIAYPRPKTIAGEDLIMPGALAIDPVDGRVFVASMKMGELFVLRDPTGDGANARFENYAGGLFQEAYSMLAEKDGLYVLHRRNLTRIREEEGQAAHFDRVFALPHGIAESYDYAYGLVRDKAGAFVMTYAPYAHRLMPGSGSAVRMVPGEKPEELAYGFRNPLGWCTGPERDIFYTDNQGEWVATNKLCHIVKGRFYGFPNPEQREHAKKPFGKTALWIPYSWARSINGVAYNASGEKFGPFDGQFFMAELMYGGAIIRASLEKVNGEYQGACFPFWGKGLLGPVVLAFDPKGRLFVGGITEPGWMAQPDRGALFRIDFTGQTPFEIQTIHARPNGFQLVFTQPVDPQTAVAAVSYSIEHYRYEYTGAYGSPELDRTPLAIAKIELAPDGRSVELQTGALIKERVYMIGATGMKSAKGEALVNPIGAYTLNEIPEPAK